MSLPHSGHRMSSRSVRKPRPTKDTEHFLQLKQSLCHWRSSKEMYLLPPNPEKAEIKSSKSNAIFRANLWGFVGGLTTDGGGAGGTFLSVEVTEAVETICKVILRGEPLAGQLLLAAGAEEAVLVPGLVTVSHATGSDGLKKKKRHTGVLFPLMLRLHHPLQKVCLSNHFQWKVYLNARQCMLRYSMFTQSMCCVFKIALYTVSRKCIQPAVFSPDKKGAAGTTSYSFYSFVYQRMSTTYNC